MLLSTHQLTINKSVNLNSYTLPKINRNMTARMWIRFFFVKPELYAEQIPVVLGPQHCPEEELNESILHLIECPQ